MLTQQNWGSSKFSYKESCMWENRKKKKYKGKRRDEELQKKLMDWILYYNMLNVPQHCVKIFYTKPRPNLTEIAENLGRILFAISSKSTPFFDLPEAHMHC